MERVPERIFALVIVTFAASASAQDPAPTVPSDCLGIENGEARLKCFDATVRTTPAPSVEPSPRPQAPAVDGLVGRWIVSEEKDKLDGAKRVVAMSIAAEDWGRDKPVLIMRCAANRTEAFVGTEKYLGTRMSFQVKWRVDNTPIRTEYWGSSGNGRAAFSQQPIPFIKALFGGKELVFNIQPYGEGPHTISFEIDGAEKAAEKVRKACGW